MKRIIFLLMVFLLASLGLRSQVVYEDVNHTSIYEFLDELASQKIISINSVVKPYSRKFIAEKLMEAKSQQDQLSRRQQKELAFYLQDFQLELPPPAVFKTRLGFLFKKKPEMAIAINPVGFFWKDSTFTFSLRPVYGAEIYSNDNGYVFHNYGGASGFAYMGKHLGGYVSLRDNHESQLLARPDFYTLSQPGVYKLTEDGGADYSEVKGGLTWSWKWGDLGIVKDNMVWGDNYHGSNIFSGRNPSFAMIKFHLDPAKWFEFNYFHGWLVSGVTDSSRSYYSNGEYREVYHPKYIAANLYTIKPWKQLHVSFGNSVVYSDAGIQAAYLIPFLFFKSADHALNLMNNDAGQNSQMFFDISSRQIKHLHLYFSMFIDELYLSKIFSKTDPHNFWSYKAGFRVSNWMLKNTSLTFEYTHTNPLVYQHYIETTTFTSDRFNLGHYLHDNSQEIYIALGYKPVRGLALNLAYTLAQHGEDHLYLHDRTIIGLKFLDKITWENHVIDFRASYEALNNLHVFAALIQGDQTGTPWHTAAHFRGQTTTLHAGFNINF